MLSRIEQVELEAERSEASVLRVEMRVEAHVKLNKSNNESKNLVKYHQISGVKGFLPDEKFYRTCAQKYI